MKMVENITTLKENIKRAREQGKTIVLIPTMGFLHRGHLSMVEGARKRDENHENMYIIMSIFVNPLQFGPSEDYEKYPRDIERDAQLAGSAGVDVLFVPSVQEMVPEGQSLTTVSVAQRSEGLCGESRPGHFQGVATIVAKLFNIALPDEAYFGQKDYQQVVVLKKMTNDLNFPVKLVIFPTVREEDGLALSSRNAYLNDEQRKQAPVLYRALQEGAALIREGEVQAEEIKDRIRQRIGKDSEGKIEYVEVRTADNLEDVNKINGPIVIALAVYFGSTRLIDNLVVEV